MSITKYQVNISKNYLLKLAIPVFFSNLATPFVGIIDTALMGHLENVKFLAAASISTAVITLIFWTFGFLRMGTVGLVSQALGKGDYREIVLITMRNLSIGLFIGILIFSFKNPILSTIKYFFVTSPETFTLIKEYISIRLFSAPAELIIYVLIGFYLGLQKTLISSILIITFSILNILFSIYFVIFLNLNIEGVALGTTLSSYITSIINNFKVIPRFKNIFRKKKIIKLFNINFNIFIRTILLTFSFLWINFKSSQLGEDYLAVNAILMQFVMLSSFFLDSYAFSTEGVIGFLIGRKKEKSFLKTVKISFELSFLTSILIAVLYVVFFKLIVNSITNLEYTRFLTYGFIFWIVILPPIASFCYQFDGIFIGASETAAMRNAMIISVASFVVLSIFLIDYFGNHGLWFSLILFMVIRSLTLYFYFPKILKKF
jgi:MATE family multidrug resistance protein